MRIHIRTDRIEKRIKLVDLRSHEMKENVPAILSSQ